MKKITALYEDVVIPGELPGSLRPEKQNHPKSTQKPSKSSARTGKQNNKKSDRDELGQNINSKRAEKMAEDPFMTQQDLKNIDERTKEKEKKAEDLENGAYEEKNNQKSESQKTNKVLNVLVSRADHIFLQAKGLFPFDFFPDTLTIDANKVNVIIKTFFATETATSVLIKEIMDVRVESTLFLGKLVIDYGPHPLKINTVYVPALRKQDALKAKEIIEGMLVIYRGENIDTTKLKPEETIQAVREIGRIEAERS